MVAFEALGDKVAGLTTLTSQSLSYSSKKVKMLAGKDSIMTVVFVARQQWKVRYQQHILGNRHAPDSRCQYSHRDSLLRRQG